MVWYTKCKSCGDDIFVRYCEKCREYTLRPGETVENGILYAETPDGGMMYMYECGPKSNTRRAKITVPAEVCGKPVTAVANNKFEDSNIQELDLPDTLKRVSRSICSWDRRLKRVKLPKYAEYIGCYAFAECNTLKDIQLPETLTFIGRFAFFNCACIEFVTVPDGVEFLADGTFSWCSSLKKVKLGSGLRKIGRAFWHCESLREITIPDGVELIVNNAFIGCENIRVKYRGKVYTQDNLSEIYDDTPLPSSYEWKRKLGRPLKYPDWVHAVPECKKTNCVNSAIDGRSVPRLPIIHSEEKVTLPREYDSYFFPAKLYCANDSIKEFVMIGHIGFEEWSDNIYGEGEEWSGKLGRLKIALVCEQARLLKKYLNIDVNLKYDRFGKLAGYLMAYYQRERWSRKGEYTEYIDVTDEWTEQLRYGYHITLVHNVPGFINTVNDMIGEYLEWCYRRELDPLQYNIIPLNTGKNGKVVPACHSDLGKLVVTERMKKDADRPC